MTAPSFFDIFDIGYGKSICQFLDPMDIRSMYWVNTTCAKIVVKFIEKKEIIFLVNQKNICTIKHSNMWRSGITRYPVKRCLFGYSDLNTILHNITFVLENASCWTITQVPRDDWVFLMIKYEDHRINCMRDFVKNQQRIVALKEAAIQEHKAFMTHTFKPKVWGKVKF